MHKQSSQAIWEGLDVPLPKDFHIQTPLYREIDTLKKENNDAFIIVIALGLILCIALIYNAHQAKHFNLHKQFKEPGLWECESKKNIKVFKPWPNKQKDG